MRTFTITAVSSLVVIILTSCSKTEIEESHEGEEVVKGKGVVKGKDIDVEMQPLSGEFVANNPRDLSNEDVMLTFSESLTNDRMLILKGESNLPEGTILSISVQEDRPNGFFGQSKCNIEVGGKFQTVKFGTAAGLGDGKYQATVTMPIPRVQPEKVRTVLGPRGENMKGPLVEEGKFGKWVNVSIEFVIGGEDAINVQMERAKTEISRYRTDIADAEKLYERLQLAKKRLKPLSNNLDEIKAWGAFARGFNQDQAELYRRRDDKKGKADAVVISLNSAVHNLWLMFDALGTGETSKYQQFSDTYHQDIADANAELESWELAE